jgi:aldehyde dehydrogenase (NAD+)
MRQDLKFYIDGAWVAPLGDERLDVINPADETVAGCIAMGNAADVDRAVKAARRAFEGYSQTSRNERIALLDRVIAAYERRMPDLAKAVTLEMGAPAWIAEQMQVVLGLAHLKTARAVLTSYEFDHPLGTTHVMKEPIGVCAFITPWNWPLNQISCKVAPALAVGCTMVLKPSEIAPFSATIYAEILHDAGVPAGVFNLVQGDGPTVGVVLSSHPGVDMVSFTGSTRAGIEVARNAAATVKRVHQELGGKSANIVLDDADLAAAVAGGIDGMMLNAGQSCNAPSRMLVPRKRMEEVIRIAREEIFGPVLAILGYDSEEEAVTIANDTPYGLAAYVQGTPERARRVAAKLRAGQIFLNGAGLDFSAPFGGYKQSGNGREWGAHAFAEFLETKAVLGFSAALA